MNLILKLKQEVNKLKEQIQVLVLAYADDRTPFIAKLVIGLTAGYLLSPIDLIPDFIPVFGFLDDIVIVPILIMLSIKLIPQIVLIEAREKAVENPEVLKKNNWIFAFFIILVWLILIYSAYIKYSHFNFKTINYAINVVTK